MAFSVLIPARLASSRLPNKPLADIGGIPMVVRVAQRAALSRASQIVVAGVSAAAHHQRHRGGRLGDAMPMSEFVTRSLRQGINAGQARLETGLSLLASVGSTAPFVGLFGTVWGIYHALVGISQSGQASIDKVAGPVGEALIMTALGLAVAIPAVLGYNALVRSNRVILADLDAFAHDLPAFLAPGARVDASAGASRIA